MDSAQQFCASVLAGGGQIESIALNERTIDIGWFGSSEPRRAFIHSSCDDAGALIQLQWLEAGLGSIPSDGAIAIVHGLETARRYQIYLSGRLLSAEHVIVIEVRIGKGRSADDQLIFEPDNIYSRMMPLTKVEYAIQEFGAPVMLFRKRWQAEVLQSGREVIEDQLARLF